ncbi:MAG: UDP-N-acetylmuramoyl-L-alanine--D-glutamate ligase, partial [Candidatus Aureabacteria bacterium]|nr:UDP-N-acetylmuramoyl-L-alanine--D-glutamate ligase [Candidatus Auribacterota bacterium]
MELVGVVKDITYINDSKATNVDALKTALTAIDKNIILIAGGIWKKDSFKKIRNLVKRKVKMCFLIGKHANVIKAQLKGVCEIQKVAGLSSAVKEASKIAIQGDTVLLSPGCSSFDMFADYRERGEVFKAEVLKRKKGGKK